MTQAAPPPKDPDHEPDPSTKRVEIEVADAELLVALTGANSAHLRLIEKEVDVEMGLRGQTIHIKGPALSVDLARSALEGLMQLLDEGGELARKTVTRVVRTLRDDPSSRPSDFQEEVVLVTAGRRVVRAKGKAQRNYTDAIRNNDIVFAIGPAGTGKTYLAMAMAVAALQARRVKRIILTRPAVEAGERLGFLPGDLAEKVNPYLRPLYDALHDMMDLDRAHGLIQRGSIEVAPLAFMRGRTLNQSFVILDEAQNTTADQMKMFLTRLGAESKAVINGDSTQVDLPGGSRSGLIDAAQLLRDVEGIRFCRFGASDVVRHPLVQRIVRAYDQRDARRAERAAGRPTPPTESTPEPT